MINYKSFKLPGDAKLRVRADKIVATVSSKNSRTIEVYVEGVANPWHLPLGDESPTQMIDEIWERRHKEEEDD